jgi:uncharacterized protein YecE (DUF72 family)
MKAEEPTLTLEERRARRQERRLKQREANVGRAEKMHAARLEAESEKDEDADVKRTEPPAINVGCSGWFYWHWRGLFYPDGMPTGEWFPHYAKSFKTVELNAPFYSWPTVNAVKTWVRQAGRGRFIYTVKACELITHVKQFKGTKMLVRDFGYIAELLGAHMGCFLFQLPPSFQYSAARLKRLLSQLDPRLRNVVEFRHRSWWRPSVYAAFRKAGAIFCSSSAPRLPDELVCTGEEVYVRFHGKTKWYRHDYTREELAVWVERIRESGAKRVWAYFNNDRDGLAIKNAKELSAQLKKLRLK